MLRSRDVTWEPNTEGNTEKSSRPMRQRRQESKKVGSPKRRPAKDKQQSDVDLPDVGKIYLPSKEKIPASTSKSSTTKGVTLKDLNQEDKQKIVRLIKELAKVGEEKENVVNELNSERKKFSSHVQQLEDEKSMLMNKQIFLSEEVKQCQTLLQYYQNLITMQQTSILARDELEKAASHFDETALNHQSSSSSQHMEPGVSIEDLSSQPIDIKVNEMYTDDTGTTNSSVSEDEVLRMSDHQYNAYLHGKKEKLKREQESLRKLLSLKVRRVADPDEIEISPVRGDQSATSDTAVEMKSVPVQTVSPSKVSTSYATPSRSFSNQTCQKSSASSQSSSTLKQLTSPEKIVHLSSHTSVEDVPFHETSIPYSSAHPLAGQDLSISSSETNIVTNVMNCDESQILEDIFFV